MTAVVYTNSVPTFENAIIGAKAGFLMSVSTTACAAPVLYLVHIKDLTVGNTAQMLSGGYLLSRAVSKVKIAIDELFHELGSGATTGAKIGFCIGTCTILVFPTPTFADFTLNVITQLGSFPLAATLGSAIGAAVGGLIERS